MCEQLQDFWGSTGIIRCEQFRDGVGTGGVGSGIIMCEQIRVMGRGRGVVTSVARSHMAVLLRGGVSTSAGEGKGGTVHKTASNNPFIPTPSGRPAVAEGLAVVWGNEGVDEHRQVCGGTHKTANDYTR